MYRPSPVKLSPPPTPLKLSPLGGKVRGGQYHVRQKGGTISRTVGGWPFWCEEGRAKVVPATPLKLSPPALKLSVGAKNPVFGGGQFHGGGSVVYLFYAHCFVSGKCHVVHSTQPWLRKHHPPGERLWKRQNNYEKGRVEGTTKSTLFSFFVGQFQKIIKVSIPKGGRGESEGTHTHTQRLHMKTRFISRPIFLFLISIFECVSSSPSPHQRPYTTGPKRQSTI